MLDEIYLQKCLGYTEGDLMVVTKVVNCVKAFIVL